ncbi:hypothetical protein ACFJGW_19890 [Burkholderiaceae bacterium UC74_6]
MKVKHLLVLCAVGLLVALGLHQTYRTSPAVQAFDRAVSRLWNATSTAGSMETHKCVSASRVEYSSGKCPAGTVEKPMDGGAITVLPATPVPQPASTPASMPTVRDLLAPASGPDLTDERIKRAIGG